MYEEGGGPLVLNVGGAAGFEITDASGHVAAMHLHPEHIQLHEEVAIGSLVILTDVKLDSYPYCKYQCDL